MTTRHGPGVVHHWLSPLAHSSSLRYSLTGKHIPLNDKLLNCIFRSDDEIVMSSFEGEGVDTTDRGRNEANLSENATQPVLSVSDIRVIDNSSENAMQSTTDIDVTVENILDVSLAKMR